EDGAVHLPDRRGRQWALLELEEQPLDRLAEVLADDALDVRERERAHVVLQAAELRDDVGRDDVRAGREELPELDEGRAELVEHLAQVPAPRTTGRTVAVGDDGRAAPAPVEHVAEAVLRHDLRDLAQPAEVPLGARRHWRSVARRLHSSCDRLRSPREAAAARRPARG